MENTARLTLPAATLEKATEPAKSMLENAQKQTGFIPNMYANMANSPGLFDTYLSGYKHFRQDSGFTSAEQEVVLLSISLENACTYCMAAHSMIAEKVSKTPQSAIDALRTGKPIPDSKLQTLSQFTRVMVSSRGMPSQKAVDAFKQAGYSERQVLEIILAIAVKTISNYTNHVFDTSVDERFAGYAWNPNQ
jgi:uncharacterized peroxidase-related enzyme